MTSFKLNGARVETAADPEKPLLWVLREDFALTGTKFGCGVGSCGACTVHLDGDPVRACSLPLSAVDGAEVTTIEGLAAAAADPVLAAWTELDVPQCGYCQCGQVMSAAALIRDVPDPQNADIDDYMSGNLCRCGTYNRIRAATKRAAELNRT
ncbi:MAG: (2Fe-2S)-binding protein [Pseudomonadota bacterium]